MRVSTSRLAAMAAVSPRAVRKARAAGRLVSIAGSNDFDTTHPLTVAFLRLHRPGRTVSTTAQIASLIAKAALVRYELIYAGMLILCAMCWFVRGLVTVMLPCSPEVLRLTAVRHSASHAIDDFASAWR